MRWDVIFADLAAQFEAEQRQEIHADAADLAEGEVGTIALTDRLRAAVGRDVTIQVRTGENLLGRIVEAQVHWIVLAEDHRRFLIPTACVATVRGLRGAAPPASPVLAKLRTTHALRAIAREATDVYVHHVAGSLSGRIARVGTDYIDVATAGGELVTVALETLSYVRSA